MATDKDNVQSKIRYYTNSRDFDKAKEISEKAISKAKKEGNINLVISLLHDLGALCGDMGDFKAAYTHTRDAYRLCRLINGDADFDALFKINNMVISLLKMDLTLDAIRLCTALYEKMVETKGDENPFTIRTQDLIRDIYIHHIGVDSHDYKRAKKVLCGVKCESDSSKITNRSYIFYIGANTVGVVKKGMTDSHDIIVMGRKDGIRIVRTMETDIPIENGRIISCSGGEGLGKIIWIEDNTDEIWRGEAKYKITVDECVDGDENTYETISVFKNDKLICVISGMLKDWPGCVMEDPRSFPHCTMLLFEDLDRIDELVFMSLPMYYFS